MNFHFSPRQLPITCTKYSLNLAKLCFMKKTVAAATLPSDEHATRSGKIFNATQKEKSVHFDLDFGIILLTNTLVFIRIILILSLAGNLVFVRTFLG